MALELADRRIAAIHSVVDPDNLRHFPGLGDYPALLKAGRPPRGRGWFPGPAARSPPHE
ncbi:hypothetical protein [Streptomyces sp. ALB3]|uniref:hypothetical protein n=1 Tax=Streptomyces sp. ALB3 TaxID=3374278 RepID=UPI0037B3447F